MTITSLDGYRWLKNDIIRGNFQPDEKLRMSLLTSRYALGVGPLREALSQLVAERLVTVVNQKGYRVASMSEQELLDIFDARANMEAMLVGLLVALVQVLVVFQAHVFIVLFQQFGNKGVLIDSS